MRERVKISVGVITYNQEATIRQTLDSIIAQKGDFDLEIVIGEDCSTDNTRAICEEYTLHHTPYTIVLLPSQKNLGIMANFARVIKACSGDLVGICAGDDYWCDEQKLQKQLDYFKVHPDVGVVSTSGYRHFVLRDEMVPGIAPLRPIEDGDIKKFYFSPDYKGGVYAMPLSLLIKRELLQYVDFDEFVKRGFPVEDYPMQAILVQHTKWGHINDLCVVYRVYKESATFISFDHPKYLEYHKGLANIRRYLNELFPDDVCFSEEWLNEYVFYKEFLLYLHQLDYKKAKELVRRASSFPSLQGEGPCPIERPVDGHRTYPGGRLLQAKRFTKSWLHFVLAHFIKERQYRKDLKKRV